jgi:hypothetical protein
MRLSKAGRRLVGVSAAAVGLFLVTPSIARASDCTFGDSICTGSACCELDGDRCGSSCDVNVSGTHTVSGPIHCHGCFES